MKSNGKNTRQQKNAERPVRWAVVGLGHIVQVAVLPAFRNAENAELVAIVSGDDEKLAKLGDDYEVEHRLGYDEYEEFLRSGEVDAVYIGLPNHMHCEYTVKAANAGVHVLCEKPMAVTEEECEQMIEACDANDVHLMIAYRLHFEPANLEVIERVANGELGTPRFFDAVFSQNVEEGNIRLNPIEKGGGSVYDMGIYAINAARYIFRDEPIRVFATSESREDDERFVDCDEMTHVTLIFPGHRLATFTSSFGADDVSSYRVVGTDAEIHAEPAFDYANELRYEVHEGGEVTDTREFEKHDQFAPELIYFSDCIAGGEEPEPNGKEGLADVRIIRAIYESARTGRTIELDPVDVEKRPEPSMEITRPGFEKPKEVNASGPSD